MKKGVAMLSKSLRSYISQALRPISIVVLLVLVIPNGLNIAKYPWYIFISLFLLFLVTIYFPIYLLGLAKRYTMEDDVKYYQSVIITFVSGIGSVLIFYKDRYNSPVDFAKEIMFFTQLIIVSVILVIGMLIIAYLRFKKMKGIAMKKN